MPANYARPAFDPKVYEALQKERPGQHRLDAKEKRTKLQSAEDAAKRKSKARDGNRCRAPHATREEFLECSKLPVESSHVAHKGRGGDPSGERSVPELLVTTGYRCHRERIDGQTKAGKTLRPKFLTPDKANGVIAWEEKRGERWIVTHVEKRIGDANECWRRK